MRFTLVLLIGIGFLWKCRAQDYGNVGGPLAKSARRLAAGPSSSEPTTAIPDFDVNLEVEQPEPNVDEYEKIDETLGKLENWTVPALEKSISYDADKFGDLCCWNEFPQQTLSGIGKNIPGQEIHFVGSAQCNNPDDCTKQCERAKCNYIVFYVNTNSANLYSVQQSVLSNLKDNQFSPYPGSKSYVRRCLRKYSSSPSCPDLSPMECEECDQFLAFVKKYNKVYSGCEFLRRFEIFKLNLRKIKILNKRRVLPEDALFDVTEFTDKSHKEFLIQHTGSLFEFGYPKKDAVSVASDWVDLELRFDWADYGVIPEPRDQGSCGACYAFTTTDLVAAQYAIDHGEFGKAYTLAPQYILDCFKDPAAFGCDGGRPPLVLKALSECANGTGGDTSCEFPFEYCHPYTARAEVACRKTSCPGAPKIQVKKYNSIDAADYFEKQKMAAIISRGPAVVLVDASDAWQFYKDGVIRPHQCTTQTNHAVLLTGFDMGVGTAGYIIRNTWGTDWGQKGYVYIEAGRNTCGVAQTVTYACTDNCTDHIGLNVSSISKAPLEKPPPVPELLPIPPETPSVPPPAPSPVSHEPPYAPPELRPVSSDTPVPPPPVPSEPSYPPSLSPPVVPVSVEPAYPPAAAQPVNPVLGNPPIPSPPQDSYPPSAAPQPQPPQATYPSAEQQPISPDLASPAAVPQLLPLQPVNPAPVGPTLELEPAYASPSPPAVPTESQYAPPAPPQPVASPTLSLEPAYQPPQPPTLAVSYPAAPTTPLSPDTQYPSAASQPAYQQQPTAPLPQEPQPPSVSLPYQSAVAQPITAQVPYAPPSAVPLPPSASPPLPLQPANPSSFPSSSPPEAPSLYTVPPSPISPPVSELADTQSHLTLRDAAIEPKSQAGQMKGSLMFRRKHRILPVVVPANLRY